MTAGVVGRDRSTKNECEGLGVNTISGLLSFLTVEKSGDGGAIVCRERGHDPKTIDRGF